MRRPTPALCLFCLCCLCLACLLCLLLWEGAWFPSPTGRVMGTSLQAPSPLRSKSTVSLLTNAHGRATLTTTAPPHCVPSKGELLCYTKLSTCGEMTPP